MKTFLEFVRKLIVWICEKNLLSTRNVRNTFKKRRLGNFYLQRFIKKKNICIFKYIFLLQNWLYVWIYVQ